MKKNIFIITVIALILGLSSTAFGVPVYVNNSTVRDANDASETCKVGWIDGAYLWTDTDVTGFDVDDIVECISGDGENDTAVITLIENIEGSYRVTVTVAGDISSWQTGNSLNFVDLDAPAAANPFKFIKSAIDRLIAPVDAIEIANGTYDKGPYTIDKSLTLQHTSDNFSPVITRTSIGNVFTINADITPVSFNGLTIKLYPGVSVGIYQTINTGTAIVINVGNCYFTGEVGADEAIDLNAPLDAGGTVNANLDVTAGGGDNWWLACYTGGGANPNTLVKTTTAGAVITVDLDSYHGASGTAVFTTTDHAEKTIDFGTLDVELTINKCPFEDETFTVKRWGCAPPGDLLQPHYTAGQYETDTAIPYQTDCYIEITSTDSWTDFVFEVEAHIQVTDLGAGTYDGYEVMRYRSTSEAGVDESDYGWVTLPGTTVEDNTGTPDEIIFTINRLGTYCMVDPGANVTAALGREMSLWITTDYTQDTPAAAYKVVYPYNQTAYPTINASDWPLIDNTYVSPYNTEHTKNNADWDIDLTENTTREYEDVTFYLAPNENSAEFCGFDVLIRWFPDKLNFSGFDPAGTEGDLADALWDNGLFEEAATGHFDNSADGYYLHTRFLDDGSGLRISVFPKQYGNDADVVAGADTYIMKLTFDVVAPGYSPIYIEYADIRAFSDAFSEPLHKFVKPYHAAFVNYLGDVWQNTGDLHTIGDGLVDSEDLAHWSLSYWAGITGSYVPALGYYLYKFDVGPTANGWLDTFPGQDGVIEFEDLIIFALSFDRNTYEVQLIRGNKSIAPRIAFGNARTSGRSTIEIPILLEDQVKDLRGASFKIDYNHDVLQFVGARKGELLENTESLSLLYAKEMFGQAWCDFAVTNGLAPAINELGELVILTFEVVGEGEYGLAFNGVRLRDSGNNEMNPDIEEPEISSYNLMQNYPNPVRNSTSISYTVPKSGNVELTIYNVLGQKVTTLVDGFKEAGYYNAQFNADDLANGIYLYRLEINDQVKTRKMLIVR